MNDFSTNIELYSEDELFSVRFTKIQYKLEYLPYGVGAKATTAQAAWHFPNAKLHAITAGPAAAPAVAPQTAPAAA